MLLEEGKPEGGLAMEPDVELLNASLRTRKILVKRSRESCVSCQGSGDSLHERLSHPCRMPLPCRGCFLWSCGDDAPGSLLLTVQPPKEGSGFCTQTAA